MENKQGRGNQGYKSEHIADMKQKYSLATVQEEYSAYAANSRNVAKQ